MSGVVVTAALSSFSHVMSASLSSGCRVRPCVSVFFGSPLYPTRFKMSESSVVFVGLKSYFNLGLYIHKKLPVSVDGLSGVVRVSYPCDTSGYVLAVEGDSAILNFMSHAASCFPPQFS